MEMEKQQLTKGCKGSKITFQGSDRPYLEVPDILKLLNSNDAFVKVRVRSISHQETERAYAYEENFLDIGDFQTSKTESYWFAKEGTIPLYLCFYPQDATYTDTHYVSADPQCGGSVVVYLLGYINPVKTKVFSVPVYECRDETNLRRTHFDHFCNEGKKIVGFVDSDQRLTIRAEP